MPAPEILLVEDDRDIREAMAEVLEQEGYVVSLAKTGLDAVQHLETCRALPAAILLDLMMPIMDGWEFSSVKQGNPQWATVPIVIVSADANVSEKGQAVRAVAHLRKPIDIDQLLGILLTVVTPPAPPPPSLAEGT
ncbi:MAG: response regulator [Deltaproteobacteria bacterium]|nr:response regulator [Deltaproteobacteria bacterium]